MNRMSAETPDVMAFNGYANQYKANPITVRRGEKIRIYVLDAGPSQWSAFHVIGTVFDRTYVEGVVGHDSQTDRTVAGRLGRVHARPGGQLPLRHPRLRRHGQGRRGHPAHHGCAEGRRSGSAAAPAAGHDEAASDADVNATLGEMWVKADKTTVGAGHLHIAVKNTGAMAHGLAIVAEPVKTTGGMLDESTFLAKGKQPAPGESATVMADLKPGRYELVCFMAGHFAAGQKLPFVVM